MREYWFTGGLHLSVTILSPNVEMEVQDEHLLPRMMSNSDELFVFMEIITENESLCIYFKF
jgi:hypothetical protein